MFPRAQHFTDITSFNPPHNPKKERITMVCVHVRKQRPGMGLSRAAGQAVSWWRGQGNPAERWAWALRPQAERGREEN